MHLLNIVTDQFNKTEYHHDWSYHYLFFFQGQNKWDENVWPHVGMPLTWNFSWYLIDERGLQELTKPAASVKKYDIDDWSDQLVEAVQRFNETEKQRNDDDDDDSDNFLQDQRR